jgi:NAD-dependent DNA ligase
VNLAEKKKLYIKASKAYYNGAARRKPIMTDAEFNKLEREIEKVDPKWPQLKKTGVKVDKKIEVPLTYFMPSLNKIYPETADKWLARRKVTAYTASHKLDGNSLQGTYTGKKWTRLVTRGDGTDGGDISFLIPHLNLPQLRVTSGEYVFRFEAVMKAKTFEKKWSIAALGEDEGFDNARNLVSGVLNRRKPHKSLKDIDFVVLGVYDMDYAEGLEWADGQGLLTVKRSLMKTLDAESLSARLRLERQKAEYEIDGLVLVPPDQHFQYDNADRPKHSVAFKINEDEDAEETVVEEVIWQISRTNRIVPKIRVRPVKMKGVEVTYATAHNAQWMTERGIGVGAVVKLVRSGDVIPKIVEVTKKAKKAAKPDVAYKIEGVHFVTQGRHKEADVREIHHFFSTLGIEHIAAKTVSKLYDAGLVSVADHLNAYTCRFGQYATAGIGDGMRKKIYTEFQRVLDDEGVSLIKIMNASNCFDSFGERKLQMIQDYYAKHGNPDVLRELVKMQPTIMNYDGLRGAIAEIKGMGNISASQFVDGLEAFHKWFKLVLKVHKIKINAPVAKVKKSGKGKFAGEFVSWTGYRSEDQEEEVEAQGGDIIKLGAKTTILFYNPNGKFMAKVEAARAKGIKTLVWGK